MCKWSPLLAGSCFVVLLPLQGAIVARYHNPRVLPWVEGEHWAFSPHLLKVDARAGKHAVRRREV